jgi:hypothetical protein
MTYGIYLYLRKGGLEPPCLSAPPPQDGVSASSTTSALKIGLVTFQNQALQKPVAWFGPEYWMAFGSQAAEAARPAADSEQAAG